MNHPVFLRGAATHRVLDRRLSQALLSFVREHATVATNRIWLTEGIFRTTQIGKGIEANTTYIVMEL